MADTTLISSPTSGRLRSLIGMLWRDKFATISVIFLICVAILAIVGPALIGELATKVALRQRNMPPGSLDAGWLYVLGADNLGRSIVARLVVGAQNTLGVALAATLIWALGEQAFLEAAQV